MEIPRSLLSELTDAVNALSASAQALAATALDEIFKEWDGSDVTGLRVECIEALEAIESVYCDTYAAGRAAEFYEGCRAAQGVRGAYSAIADSRRDPQALAGAVRAMVQYVVDGDTDRYRRECLSRIDADVRRSANSCVAYNTRRDPKKPRYARVPTGGETCGFCLMLSSFGFHYTTEEAAGHAHDGCDCRVVPNFGKASVKGYDSDGMYSRYQDVLETLGGRDGIRAEWDALPKEEREAYIASHGKKEGAAFQKYMNKRMVEEIELRDPKWYATGEHSGIEFAGSTVKDEKLKRWRQYPGERITAEKINALGYKTEFWEDESHLAAPNADGKTTISRADLSTGIELKTIYGAGSENTFKSHIKSISGKNGVKLTVVDVSENEKVTDEQAIKWINKYMARYHISEVRMLGHDGKLLRIKK
jgi:hypothetical protein|nr:MAG TPA: minor capsid protein 2 [Bacteriophage sp.]